MEPKGEVEIDATELRVGDYILRADKQGEHTRGNCRGLWNVFVVKEGDYLGYRDKYNSRRFHPESANHLDGRWVKGQKFWVRSPRPEPESNEFGLVTP